MDEFDRGYWVLTAGRAGPAAESFDCLIDGEGRVVKRDPWETSWSDASVRRRDVTHVLAGTAGVRAGLDSPTSHLESL